MPATPVNPSASIVVMDGTGSLYGSTLLALQPEEHLLMHKVRRSAKRDELSETNSEGRLILHVRSNPVLRYDCEATVLQQAGLANYHPGQNLSDRSLAFLNGEVAPFGFQAEISGERAGRLMYEDPVQELAGGDTMECSFSIVHRFIDLNWTTEATADSAEFLAWYAARSMLGEGRKLSAGTWGATVWTVGAAGGWFAVDPPATASGRTVSLWAETDGFCTGTAAAVEDTVDGSGNFQVNPAAGWYRVFLW